MFKVPEKYRVKNGMLRSNASAGNNGAFLIRSLKFNRELRIIASDGMGWEHVSVSTYDRCPTWDEMCFIKNLFWGSEDCVVQYHPPESEYVNNQPYTLHLWRPKNTFMPAPPSILVGIKEGSGNV